MSYFIEIINALIHEVMRKLIYLIILLFVTSQFSILQAQIKVSENGHVGINFDNTPLSKLVLNHVGHSDFEAYFYTPSKSYGGGLMISSEASTGSHVISLYGYIYSGSGYGYGVKGTAYNSSASSSGRAYGVQAYAGNATSGFNYAVYGRLLGSNNGAGIFGANTTKGDISIPGKYAGYFRGDVKIEDALWAYSITESDVKFKTNIQDIPDDEYLSKFNQIRPVEYNLVQREISIPSDTTSTVKYFEEDSQILTKKKFGIIAQELQEIYPNLVYKSQEGDLGIDYIGLIPILIKTVQVQQLKIEMLENMIKLLNKDPYNNEDD